MNSSELISAYSKDSINNYEMEDFSVKMEQKNNICGDNVVVYLKIEKSGDQLSRLVGIGAESGEKNMEKYIESRGESIIHSTKTIPQEKYIIKKYSYTGVPQMFTSASASFLAEIIEGQDIDTVLTWDYDFMKEHGFEVSPRRRRAIVTPLLAIRNAIHAWKGDGIVEEYENLL